MTFFTVVTPAKAGVQRFTGSGACPELDPGFAGTTLQKVVTPTQVGVQLL